MEPFQKGSSIYKSWHWFWEKYIWNSGNMALKSSLFLWNSKPQHSPFLVFLPRKMKPIFQHPNEYFKDECFLKLIGAHYHGIKSQMDWRQLRLITFIILFSPKTFLIFSSSDPWAFRQVFWQVVSQQESSKKGPETAAGRRDRWGGRIHEKQLCRRSLQVVGWLRVVAKLFL